MNVSRLEAEKWAPWFRALSDPTRLLILNLLATERRSMTVGEITEHLDVGQSTISHHLGLLAEVRFALVERVATTSLWRLNERCLECFPDAAALVLGKVPADFLEALECR
jgi:DNA-binding transcriptional ArsR family regulator